MQLSSSFLLLLFASPLIMNQACRNKAPTMMMMMMKKETECEETSKRFSPFTNNKKKRLVGLVGATISLCLIHTFSLNSYTQIKYTGNMDATLTSASRPAHSLHSNLFYTLKTEREREREKGRET